MKKSSYMVGVGLRHGGVFFRIWTPFAHAVSLIGTFNDWSATLMDNEKNGYFSLLVKNAKPGHEYKFVIDTGSSLLVRNDPVSYHISWAGGNSVIPGPLPEHRKKDSFAPTVNNKKIFYEMHIGTFYSNDPGESGTFADAASKLDYLSDLGITDIELMPIHSMHNGKGWGYKPEFIYSVESTYGGRNHFADYIELAHQKGIGVTLDVVYNHLGGERTDLWQFDGWSEDSGGGIYFYNDWRGATPWGNTRLDYGRPEVYDYIRNNAKMWLEDFKIDGLRLDSTVYMRNVDGQDNNPSKDIPEAWHLLQDINADAKKSGKDKFIISEDTGNNDYITKPKAEGGADFNAQWDLRFPYALRKVLEPIKDEDRGLSELCAELTRTYNGDAMQRIIFSDSHDTDGNNHHRLNQEINPTSPHGVYAKKRSLIASSIVLTAPGIPLLLQGQEFMQEGTFNEWQPLDWNNVEKNRGILLAHKHLISLRKNNENITNGLTGNNIEILHTDDSTKVLAYHRWDKGGPADDVLVIANFSNRLVHDYFVHFPKVGEWKLRFNSSWHGYSSDFKKYNVTDITVEADGSNIEIPPYTVLIYSQNL